MRPHDIELALAGCSPDTLDRIARVLADYDLALHRDITALVVDDIKLADEFLQALYQYRITEIHGERREKVVPTSEDLRLREREIWKMRKHVHRPKR